MVVVVVVGGQIVGKILLVVFSLVFIHIISVALKGLGWP